MFIMESVGYSESKSLFENNFKYLFAPNWFVLYTNPSRSISFLVKMSVLFWWHVRTTVIYKCPSFWGWQLSTLTKAGYDTWHPPPATKGFTVSCLQIQGKTSAKEVYHNGYRVIYLLCIRFHNLISRINHFKWDGISVSWGYESNTNTLEMILYTISW